MLIMGVSAVTVSFDCKKLIFRLLDSLYESSFKNLEIIVVDNGSSDGTLQEGRRKYKKVKWVDAGPVNIGWGGSYNLGFANVKKGNHILLIDSDLVADRNLVSDLVERLKSNSKIGIVTPMILYLSDKSWVNQAGAEVNLWTGRVTVGWGPKVNFLEAKRVQNSGTVLLIRNEVVDKIGGFDNWLTGYLDPDYCLRAGNVGFETWYEPKAIVYHDQSKDKRVWGPRLFNRAYLIGRNRVLFMRRHGNNFLIFSLFIPIFLAYYFKEAFKYGLLQKWFDIVKGTADGFFYPLFLKSKIALPSLVKRDKPKVSIVIPTHNSKTLTYCIKSLINQSLEPSEIIIINNSNVDLLEKVFKKVKSKYKNIKIVNCNKNLGVSGGRNKGIKETRKDCDYILFFDHDMDADREMLFELVRVAESDKSIGITTPKIYFYSDKNRIWAAGTGIDLWTGHILFRGGKDTGQYELAEEVEVAPAAILAKKEVIERINGFDDVYFATYEDTDFCFRARRAGYKTFYTPGAIAYHRIPSSYEEESRRLLGRLYFIARNRVIFLSRFGKATSYVFLPVFAVYYLKLTLRFRNLKVYLDYIKGLRDGFKYILNKYEF